MKKNAPGCNCCSVGCEVTCGGHTQLIRGWDFTIQDIPHIWTFYRRIGLLGTNYRITFTGYDYFNGHYTVYLDPGNECAEIPVIVEESMITITSEQIPTDDCDDCVDDNNIQSCDWPVRLVANTASIGLFDISDPFVDYCSPSGLVSLYQKLWLFGANFDDTQLCKDEDVTLAYGPDGYPLPTDETICYDCPDTTPSGLITFSRRTIYV